MELREPELQRTVEYSICGNIMEANIVSQDTSHTSPLSGTLTIPSIPSSSPPPLSSHPPARPCRPKQPPSTAKASHVPSRPPLPTSAPLSLPPPVSKPPPPIPIKADPPFVPTPLSSNPPPLALVPPLSPTMASTCPLSSPQPNVSYDLSSTFTHAALPLLLSATTSLASSSSPSPPPLPVMPPFSPTAPLPSPIDRLLSTTSVWQPKGLSQSQITAILEKEAAGVFVVHSTEDNDMILSVRVSDEHEAPLVHSVMFKQLKTYVHLDGSCMVFDDIFKLISFYCVSRDILAVRLMLPWAITTATRREDLEAISAMGADFWTSYLNQKVKKQDQDLVQQHNGLYWYVNPVPVEKCPEIDPNTTATCIHDITHQNITSSPQIGPEAKGQIQIKTNKEIKYKRPPPRPPSLGCGMGLLFSAPSLSQSSSSITTAAERKEEGKGGGGEKEGRKLTLISPPPLRPSVLLQSRATPPLPPAPLHGTACKKSTYQEVGEGTGREKGQNPAEKIEKEGGGEKGEEVVDQENSNQQQEEEEEKGKKKEVEKEEKKEDKQIYQSQCRSLSTKPSRPVPPPRKKRPPLCPSETEGGSANQTAGKRPSPPSQMPRPDVSLYSPQGGAALGPDPDSCSTSSTEEEAEPLQEQEQNHNCPTGSHSPKAAMKRTSTTIMLDRARYRLSTVLTGLISHDRRLTQRVIEMARAPTSYIGNLVKEHRAFTLETMSKHLTSTELLQEIRQMMTQLKSYLLQSAELQALLEPQHQYSQDKIENIVEAALCKSVLKPLREPIYHSLEKLHTANGSLKQLTQNQSIVLGSTTTALGITTAVPEASAMEKISIKLNNLHLEYSPQKKIELLLKSCKIIYDAMSVSCPGRTHGADDFLPVMMYVLARSNLSALQLDVEYMMELMDPSLTLGEGSYYLTTTYGALEHIKTFDQQRSATRQLSREVQDSIHRWERRRTLNKDSTSQGSIRDFLTVCCPEIDANPKTLGVLPTTTIQQLSEQCTARFEQGEDSYTLSVYIDGVHQPLALTELALSVKNSCQPGTYCFVYHPIGQPSNKPSRTCPSDPPPAPPAESLFTASTQPVNTVETEAAEEILIEL